MATYGCSVSLALSGDRVVGTRGFSEYLEKLETGIFLTKLDASLDVDEFAVSVRPHTSLDPGVWAFSAWKVVNPPDNRPPGTYVVAIIVRDGVLEDHDFDVIATTFS